MSWYSDREPFNEYEGCGHCQFKDRKSPYTCGECEWNSEDFGDNPCDECDGSGCDNCHYAHEDEEEDEIFSCFERKDDK